MSQLDYSLIDPDSYDFENCITRLDRYGEFSPLDVVAAIKKTHGSFATMAKLLGRTRRGVRDYVLGNSEVKAEFDEVRESLIDHVETSVFENAMKGDGPSQRFVLSTIGKDRGYTTRTETSGPNGGPVQLEAVDARGTLTDRVNRLAQRIGQGRVPTESETARSGGVTLELENVGTPEAAASSG